MVTTGQNTALTLRSVIGDYYLSLNKQLGARWAGLVASEFPTNQPSEQYPWLRASPKLRKWEGERSAQELGSDSVTIFNDDYEATIEFRVPDFRRDKTSQIQARIADMAQRVAQHPERILTDLLIANGTATYDGTAFFATGRTIGDSGTINNALTASQGLAGGAAPSTAQQSNNLLIGITQLMSFLDDKGEPLNEGAREFVVMTPPALWGPTVAAISAAFTSASATNPLSELRSVGVKFMPVMNARLTTTNQFYMFRADAGIKALILQEEEVNPVALDRDSEHAIKTNKVLFGHGWVGGVGYGRPELALRLTNA